MVPNSVWTFKELVYAELDKLPFKATKERRLVRNVAFATTLLKICMSLPLSEGHRDLWYPKSVPMRGEPQATNFRLPANHWLLHQTWKAVLDGLLCRFGFGRCHPSNNHEVIAIQRVWRLVSPMVSDVGNPAPVSPIGRFSLTTKAGRGAIQIQAFGLPRRNRAKLGAISSSSPKFLEEVLRFRDRCWFRPARLLWYWILGSPIGKGRLVQALRPVLRAQKICPVPASLGRKNCSNLPSFTACQQNRENRAYLELKERDDETIC